MAKATGYGATTLARIAAVKTDAGASLMGRLVAGARGQCIAPSVDVGRRLLHPTI